MNDVFFNIVSSLDKLAQLIADLKPAGFGSDQMLSKNDAIIKFNNNSYQTFIFHRIQKTIVNLQNFIEGPEVVLDKRHLDLIDSYNDQFSFHLRDFIENNNRQFSQSSAYNLDLLLNSFTIDLNELSNLNESRTSKEMSRAKTKIRRIENDLGTIENQSEDLKPKLAALQDILSSRNTETLKSSLESLDKIHRFLGSVAEHENTLVMHRETAEHLVNQIQNELNTSNQSYENIVSILNKMETAQKESESITEKCKEVFGIATATGLSGAFSKRAEHLMKSGQLWFFGLVIALGIGGFTGYLQANSIRGLLSQAAPNWYALLIDGILFLGSVGGPIWVAWLATKQISYRFKLEEDYAYKASVAQAYQGFKQEALGHGKQVEERLFKAALSRLEESPLRHVDQANHGSPWHELLANTNFQKWLKELPLDVKDKLFDLAKHGIDSVVATKSNKASTEEKSKTADQGKAEAS